MAEYDSDSSLEDAGDATETNVILGFASGKPSEGAISHLGGHPIWLDPSRTPPPALAKCKVCNGYMSLLLQLNGELPSQFPDDERRLHVFYCRWKVCARKIGSVRAIREVKKHRSEGAKRPTADESKQKVEENRPPQDLGAALFGTTTNSTSSTLNPFSTSSSPTLSANPFASLGGTSILGAIPPQRIEDPSEPPVETFAQKLRISSPQRDVEESKSEPWPAESTFPPPFPTHDLENDYELLYSDSPSQPEAGASKAQYDTEDSSANGAEKDLFESDVDKTFLKFSDRLAHNPEQVLRYEFSGIPLLYSGNDAVASRFVVPHGRTGPVQGIPRCESCGAKRVFEFQLVPGAISVLEDGEELVDLDSGMEWGTIVLGVCSNDCGELGEVAFKEEWVGVQWEERLVKKRDS